MRQNKGILIAALILIEVLSLTTIWSTVPSLFLTQLTFVLVGVIIIYLIGKLDLTVLFSLSWVFYILSIVLLIVTMFIGQNTRGSVRWIDLGFFNLQTSEIVKPLLAIVYSDFLSRNKNMNWKKLLSFLMVAMLPVVIVLIQPDLGSALTLTFLPVALLALTGYFKKMLLLGVCFLIVAIPLESKLLKPYQKQRLETFINPYSDPKGAGYNVIQASIAVGSGGIIGKGVKLGTQSHLNFLPERHTDFIFASFAEEFGFLGISVLFLGYYVFLSGCLKSVLLLKGEFSLLSMSVFLLFIFQAVVNIGMNLGIMPVTGITLPLFSYGGSSLLSFSILVGLMLVQLDLITPFEI